MSTIASTYLPEDVLLLGDATPVIGTAVLGDDFGKVQSLAIKRTGDEEELTNGAGGLRAHVVKKPGVEGTLEVKFDAEVVAPAIYAIISLPVVGIAARVMPGVDVKYDDGKERTMTIPVKMWDSLLGQPAYRLDTLTGLKYLLDIGIPVSVISTTSGHIVNNWPDVDGATSYEIQVSSDAGVTWTALATPTPSTYDHTVTTGQTRHYRIRAVNADGSGEWSEVTTTTAA